MATKKTRAASDKPLKAEVKKLRSDLASAKAKRDQWKKRALKAEASRDDLQARLKAAEKRVKKVNKARSATAAPVASPDPGVPSALPVTTSAPSDELPPATDGVPRAANPGPSWTVTQLRAEARQRGIAGMSKKPKAELLAILT